MNKLSIALFLVILSIVMIFLCGCFEYKRWPKITSSGVKDLGAGTYYVNVESDYNRIDDLLKTAHDAASYECMTKGKDMIVISQEIIGFSNIQLIFSCIEKDGPDMQQ